MKNHRIFNGENVYQATKRRLRTVFQSYDDVICNFSGGKDSLTVVLLAAEVLAELHEAEPAGTPPRKLKVLFFDEEFVYPETLATVERVFALPFIEGYWMTLQMDSEMLMPDGSIKSIVFYDEKRGPHNWMRPKRAGSISDLDETFDLYKAEEAVAKHIFKDRNKRYCQLLGLRAEESVTRLYRVCSNYRQGENAFLGKSHIPNITLGVPIYDWMIKDIFYFLKTQQVTQINELYWKELLTKRNLRVDTPLHAKNRNSIHMIRAINPEFYQRMCEIFPEIDNSARYLMSLKGHGDYDLTIQKYGCTLRGVLKYVDETLTDPLQRNNAIKTVQHFAKNYVMNGKFDVYHYTKDEVVAVLFKEIIKRNFDKEILLYVKSTK